MQALHRLREHLAHADALLPLALAAQVTLTPLEQHEGFEGLSWPYRIGLPLTGGLIIGILFQRAAVGSRQVGAASARSWTGGC